MWDAQKQKLYWIDSFDGRVFRCTAEAHEIRAWDVLQKIGPMALRRDGGAIVSLQRGSHTLDFETGEVALVHDPELGRDADRLDDGKLERHGRFIAGSMERSVMFGGMAKPPLPHF